MNRYRPLYLMAGLAVILINISLVPCDAAAPTFPPPGANSAVAMLDRLSRNSSFEAADVSLASISDKASNEIRAWAAHRQLPMSQVAKRGYIMDYGSSHGEERSYMCFRFNALPPKRYVGVVCVGDDGTYLGEDSTSR